MDPLLLFNWFVFFLLLLCSVVAFLTPSTVG
ncbi:hypothetical protein A5883_003071 [Enterococcus sp. 5B3_DIV0040]|nr:hypothetical protein A5883_003071 [Enterococcus sp. 5B3_DIV0040]